MSDSSFSLTGLAAGDQIVTQGYYAANDGGAATFAVKSGSTADGVFTHTLYGYSGLIAELVIQDGVVNVDQLGANGNAVLPSSYDDVVTTQSECNTRTNATINANNNAFDNASVLAAACQSTRVREIRLTPGKIYGVKSSVSISSDHILNGCGAAIMNLQSTSEVYLLRCDGTATHFVENVEICNLRLIGNFIINSPDVRGIWIQYGRNIRIHDVQVERCKTAIHTTAESVQAAAGNTNQVDIDRVSIKESVTGIQYNAVWDSHIADSEISVDYTSLFNYDNEAHCVYAADAVRRCRFSNLSLRNSTGGNGILIKGSDNMGHSEELELENLSIDACHKAIGFEAEVHHVSVRNVTATTLRETGINLAGATHVVVSDCSFTGDADYVVPINTDPPCGFKIATGNATTAHIVIQRCRFLFPTKFFVIGQDRYENCYDLKIQYCDFKVTTPQLNQKLVPAYIKGIVSDIRFFRCRFETDGFTTENHSKCGVFFYFSSELAAPDNNTGIPKSLNKMHWFFDECSFINNGTVNVNSPILSQNPLDEHGTVFCTVTRSLFDGFRWTIRIANSDPTSDVNKTPSVTFFVINPCALGHDSSLELLAIQSLNQRKRFLSYRNLYREPTISGNGMQYRAAEEYGC